MPLRKCLFFECIGLVPLAFGLLVGCATRSASTVGANVLERVFSSSAEVDQASLNPAFVYVRFTRSGAPAFLARGVNRPDGGLNRETYYSAQRETLELLDGRVVSLDANREMFRWNTPSAPPWDSLKLENGRLEKLGTILLSYDRSVDLQAPYRYGYQESVTLRSRVATEISPKYLRLYDRDTLVWFEETVVPEGAGKVAGGTWGVRKNLFGLNPTTRSVVYSEQCPYPAACFSIEQWQVAPR